MAPLPTGKARVLYLSRGGNRMQIRLRVIPYPGSERVVWERESRYNPQQRPYPEAAYASSPSFSHIVVVWRPAASMDLAGEVYIVNLATGEEQRLPILSTYAYWADDHTLRLVSRGLPAEEVTYDLRTNTQVGVRHYHTDLEALRAGFARDLGALDALLGAERLPLTLPAERAALALLRSEGVSQNTGLFIEAGPSVKPVIALSPDRRYVATTSGEREVVVSHVEGAQVRTVKTIPLGYLVEDEGVSARDLRWSSDSKSLTFTESHYHPPQYYLLQHGPAPDPSDWTHLVRFYAVDTRRVATIAVGSNAFIDGTPILHEPTSGG